MFSFLILKDGFVYKSQTNLVFHVGGKTLIEPQVVPPLGEAKFDQRKKDPFAKCGQQKSMIVICNWVLVGRPLTILSSFLYFVRSGVIVIMNLTLSVTRLPNH